MQRLLLIVMLSFFSWGYVFGEKLIVVTTTGILGDLVSNVAGKDANVSWIMNSHIDPHTYRPVRSDIVKMGEADLVFVSGINLEMQMKGFFEDLSLVKTVISVGDTLDKSRLIMPVTHVKAYDPHIWMDPVLWSDMVYPIRDGLCKLDSVHCDGYTRRAEEYKKTLLKFSDYLANILSTVPTKSRFMVTSHDAFNYFGRRFGFEVEGIQGISTDSETSVKRISVLLDIMIKRKVHAIFTETTVSARNIDAIVAGATEKGFKVIKSPALFSDAMGKEGTREGNYLGMMEHNVREVTSSLGGKVPKKWFYQLQK